MGQADLFDDGMPVLPYAGTSGFSGTDTSKERALKQDSDGTSAKIQRRVMQDLDTHSEYGATWKELADLLGLHHGTVSGALSVLHKTGYISRLKDKRNGCKIYVLPNFVNGRTVEYQKPKVKCCPHCGGNL
jgi:DNA-binding transcriptional ArsR family regulator